MKTCSNKKCKQQNPQSLEAFGVQKDKKDGLRSQCKICRNEQGRNRIKTAEDKERARQSTAKYRIRHSDRVIEQREKAKKDPQFKEKSRLSTAKHRAKYPEKTLQRSREIQNRDREKINERNRERRRRNREEVRRKENERNSSPEVKKLRRASAKKSRLKNLAKDCAKSNKRYASKINRIPSWSTKEHADQIVEIYQLCEDLQWLNDPQDPLQVDHIFPLQGDTISGLHIPENLQILPRSLNVKKSNKLLAEDVESHKIFVMQAINKKPDTE